MNNRETMLLFTAHFCTGSEADLMQCRFNSFIRGMWGAQSSPVTLQYGSATISNVSCHWFLFPYTGQIKINRLLTQLQHFFN